MKRPLRYRTMGAVREGRGNPSPYSILRCLKPVGIFSAQNKTSATKSKQRSLGLFWFVKKIVLVRKSFD